MHLHFHFYSDGTMSLNPIALYLGCRITSVFQFHSCTNSSHKTAWVIFEPLCCHVTHLLKHFSLPLDTTPNFCSLTLKALTQLYPTFFKYILPVPSFSQTCPFGIHLLYRNIFHIAACPWNALFTPSKK